MIDLLPVYDLCFVILIAVVGFFVYCFLNSVVGNNITTCGKVNKNKREKE